MIKETFNHALVTLRIPLDTSLPDCVGFKGYIKICVGFLNPLWLRTQILPSRIYLSEP